MARILTIEEIANSEMGTGYCQELWLHAGEKWQEGYLDIEPCVWLHSKVYLDYSFFDIIKNEEEYNKYFVPTYDDVIDEGNDDLTVSVGYRIWNEKPTEEEAKNTPWILREVS